MSYFRFVFTLFAVFLCASCASVSVKELHWLESDPPSRLPKTVFVAPFTFTQDALRVDREGVALDGFKFQLQEKMTRHLVQRLPRYVAPAKAVASTAPLPRGNYWLLRGHFDRVNQGSRFLRAVVGLGTGATLMDTTVTLYDLSGPRPKPFPRIVTTGGSNISPGIGGVATFFVSGPTALFSFSNVVEGLRTGVTFDAIRTTREINAALSEYLYQRGAISYKQAIGPKRLGKLPNTIALPDRKRKRGSIQVAPVPQETQQGAVKKSPLF